MSKKVLILSGSPRKGGNSDILCDEFLRGAQEAGNEAEKIFVCTFYIFTEKIRGNFYSEFSALQRNRTDEFEPGIELLRINVVFNDLQTICPYRDMSFLVCHSGRRKN